MMRCIGFICFLLLVSACSEQTSLPPVVELSWHPQTNQMAKIHRVRKGETLYAVAFRYDKDYRLLADYNHLERPYNLHAGQVLHLQYLTEDPNRVYAPVQTAGRRSMRQPLPAKRPVIASR